MRHLGERKKKHVNKQTPFKKFIDKLIYIFVFGVPILTIPQITKIWFGQNASGVSLIAWTTYMVSSVVWLFYGIAHKEKPIIISGAIWIVLDLFIVVGIVLYG